jgi:hypothetical protein
VAYGTFLQFNHSSESVNTPKRPGDYIGPSRQTIKPSFSQRAGRYLTGFQDPHLSTYSVLLGHHEVPSLARAGVASVCQRL